MRLCIAGAVALLSLLAPLAAAPALIRNGDFEQGLEGWHTSHDWYAQPAGAGLSPVSAAKGEGRGGSTALKMVGGGKRGIVMQVFGAYPGRYRVSGWIRCENLGAAQAAILVEWLDRGSKWLSGDTAGAVSGASDWKHFDTVVTAPAAARSVHFDLLTSGTNTGTVWFDDVAMERVPGTTGPPTPPTIAANSADDSAGQLTLTWPADKVPGEVVRYLIYATDRRTAFIADMVPLTVAEPSSGKVVLPALSTGRIYRLCAVAVNADGVASPPGPWIMAKVDDRQAPRPGFISAERQDGNRVLVGWMPHYASAPANAIEVGLPGVPAQLVDIGEARKLHRPFYCTEPWVKVPLTGPANAAQVTVRVRGTNGRWSVPATAPVLAPAGSGQPWVLWTTGPTAQLRRDAAAPAELPTALAVLAQPGEAEGRQLMLRPTQALHDVRVRFESLRREGGHDLIASRYLAGHFVNYVKIDKNSRETRGPELVWKAPAEYPDELSDDPVRDLPANEIQPIFCRLTVPRNANPGTYRGAVTILAREGTQTLPVTLQVTPQPTADPLKLKFVYWYTWDEACRKSGIEPRSAEAWRYLAKLAEMMITYHQNVVVVDQGLVKAWQMPDGRLRCDFSDFDRYVRVFQAAGVDKLFCLSHVGSRTTGDWECPTMAAHPFGARRADNGESLQLKTLDMLPAIQEHIEKLGLLDRFAAHVADEPIKPNEASYKALAAAVRKAAPKLRRIDAIHIPSLRESVEIMVPQLNYLQQWLGEYQAAQKAGTELWFYVAWVPQGAFPNRMIDSSAIKPRVLHWMHPRYGTTGYLHWALNHWQIPLSSLESPGDQYITWPSTRFAANSSLRYESERDGLEDAELMLQLRAALERKGLSPAAAKAKVDDLAAPAVKDFTTFTRSWEVMEAVRKAMLAAMAAAP